MGYLTKVWWGKRWRYLHTSKHYGLFTFWRMGVVSYKREVTGKHACQRCGSDEWEYVDYGGCSVCRPHEERAAEDIQ